MKGNNTLSLCPAEVKQMVQEYIDSRFREDVKVTMVRPNGQDGHLTINITSDEQE